jgi:hypothetical protein
LFVISERFWREGSGGTLATYLITKLLATYDFKITVITRTCNPTKIEGVNFVIDEAFRISNKSTRWLYFLRPSVRKRYKDLMRKFDIIYIPYGYPLIPIAEELDKKVIEAHSTGLLKILRRFGYECLVSAGTPCYIIARKSNGKN